jgi:hypothetical protein
MGFYGGVTYQFVIAFDGIKIIEIETVDVVGIPVVAFSQISGDQPSATVGGHKHKVIITLFEKQLT